MELMSWISGGILALLFGAVGTAKVIRHETMKAAAVEANMTEAQYRLLGVAELAGVVGVGAGLFIERLHRLGVVAATGLLIVGLGGIRFQRQHGDEIKDAAPAYLITGATVLYLVSMAL